MINKEKVKELLAEIDLSNEEEQMFLDLYSKVENKDIFESLILKLFNYKESTIDKKTGLPKRILNILEKGKADEEERKVLFEFFKSRNDIDNYGGGGVDGGGIYSDYFTNYKKPNQLIYKVYEI